MFLICLSLFLILKEKQINFRKMKITYEKFNKIFKKNIATRISKKKFSPRWRWKQTIFLFWPRVSQIFQGLIGLACCNTCFGVIKFRFIIFGNSQKVISTLPNIDTHTFTPIDIDPDIYNIQTYKHMYSKKSFKQRKPVEDMVLIKVIFMLKFVNSKNSSRYTRLYLS